MGSDIRSAKNIADLVVILQKLMRESKLAIFCGSGISVPPPSCLPTVASVRDDLESYLIARFQTEPFNYLRSPDFGAAVKESVCSLPFEMLLEFLFESYEPEHNVSGFFREFLQREPNSFHESLAHLASRASRLHVFTTNFDPLLEKALERRGVKYTLRFRQREPLWRFWEHSIRLHKIHGSVQLIDGAAMLDSMAFRFRDLKRLAPWKQKLLTRVFSTHIVIFLGYSFSDFLDIAPFLLSLSAHGCVFVQFDPTSPLAMCVGEAMDTQNTHLRAFLQQGRCVAVRGDSLEFVRLLCANPDRTPTANPEPLRISKYLRSSLNDFFFVARLFLFPVPRPGTRDFFSAFLTKCENLKSNASLAYHDLAVVYESEGRIDEAISASMASYASACESASTPWMHTYVETFSFSSFRNLRQRVAEHWAGRGWSFLNVYSPLSIDPVRWNWSIATNGRDPDLTFFRQINHDIGLSYDTCVDVSSPRMIDLDEHAIRKLVQREIDLQMLENHSIAERGVQLAWLLLRHHELPMCFHVAHTMDVAISLCFNSLKRDREFVAPHTLIELRALELSRIRLYCIIVSVFLIAADEMLAEGKEPLRYRHQVLQRIRMMIRRGARINDWETGRFVACLHLIARRFFGLSSDKFVNDMARKLGFTPREVFRHNTGHELRSM
jgi:hypothetical protein